jgi:hypothetical protein
MQLVMRLALTPTLSPGEREAHCDRLQSSANAELYPTLETILLLPGEKAGMRADVALD